MTADPKDAQDSSNRSLGERVHRIGFVSNGALAGMKIAFGAAAGSPGLLADGYHSLADLATNGGAWLSFRVAQEPPDEDHHYGHGKAEAAAGLAIGLILMGVGVLLCINSWSTRSPDYGGRELTYVGIAALLSIGTNEWLARITRKAADALGSHALRALSRDNRSDALSSLIVMIGIAAGFAGVVWAEAAVTLLIGISIAHMGQRSARESFDVLMDRVVDPGRRSAIEDLAREVDGVEDVQAVQIHPLGSSLRVDMEVSVNGTLSVSKGHAIAHAVESRITHEQSDVVQVSVHVNPASE